MRVITAWSVICVTPLTEGADGLRVRRELTALVECIGLACCILDGKREPVIGLRDLKKPQPCDGRFDRSSTLAHLLGPRAVVVSLGLGFTEQRKECIVHGDNADAQAMLGALFQFPAWQPIGWLI